MIGWREEKEKQWKSERVQANNFLLLQCKLHYGCFAKEIARSHIAYSTPGVGKSHNEKRWNCTGTSYPQTKTLHETSLNKNRKSLHSLSFSHTHARTLIYLIYSSELNVNLIPSGRRLLPNDHTCHGNGPECPSAAGPRQYVPPVLILHGTVLQSPHFITANQSVPADWCTVGRR